MINTYIYAYIYLYIRIWCMCVQMQIPKKRSVTFLKEKRGGDREKKPKVCFFHQEWPSSTATSFFGASSRKRRFEPRKLWPANFPDLVFSRWNFGSLQPLGNGKGHQVTFPYCWWQPEIRRENQLRFVVYPIIYRVLYIQGGCLGFLPSTVSPISTARLLLRPPTDLIGAAGNHHKQIVAIFWIALFHNFQHKTFCLLV